VLDLRHLLPRDPGVFRRPVDDLVVDVLKAQALGHQPADLLGARARGHRDGDDLHAHERPSPW